MSDDEFDREYPPERIRRIEGAFGQAAYLVRSMGKAEKLSDKVLLEFYGLYKVVTLGPCPEKPPSMFNIKAKAKWKAWIAASNYHTLEAMGKYVELARQAFCWEPEHLGSGDNEPRGGMGNSVSAFAIPEDEDEGAEDDEWTPAFSWARDGCTSQLAEWIKDNEAFINVKDAKGMTLLHWAVDRGHLDTCKVLLEAGADPVLRDKEGTSPLEYAETCEHDEIVVLLKEKLSIE